MTDVELAFVAGPGIGLGHRRRMEALEAALVKLDASARLVELPGVIDPAPVVVVDAYGFEPKWLPASTDVVAVVDDHGCRPQVDIVIDPTPGVESSDESIPIVLAGGRHALVHPSLAELSVAEIATDVTSVLVASGGTDAAGVGAAMAADVQRALPDTEVRLVVGPWGDVDVPSGVVPLIAPAGLGPELARCDLVVTAGGVTMLESLALRRPTIAVVLVENQQRAVRGAVSQGALLATEPSGVAATARLLADDVDERRRLSSRAHDVVDGHGAHRVARRLLDAAAGGGAK